MALATSDLYHLASDLAAEHGDAACDYASRAVMTLEAEGNHDRAQFWFVMLILLAMSSATASIPIATSRFIS